jgi:hypothetical protein
MRKTISSLALGLILSAMIWAQADAVTLDRQVLSVAGSATLSSVHLKSGCTVGQAAAGSSSSALLRCVTGFWQDFSVGGVTPGCCVARVGDANMSGDDEPTIGDISTMINAKYIAGTCDGVLTCLTEADINLSGHGTPICSDITIGDISSLIDYLFITGPSRGLPNCP